MIWNLFIWYEHMMLYDTGKKSKRDKGYIQNSQKNRWKFEDYRPVDRLLWNDICADLIDP